MTQIPTGPIEEAPWGAIPRDDRPMNDRHRAVLAEALEGIELGAYDRQIVEWLAGWDGPTVATVASWLQRARQAETARERA